jgi:putative transposase
LVPPANTIERLNREIKRRSDVVGIFPNLLALLRLASALLEETHEEWMVCRRYFIQASMQLLLRKEQDSLVALQAHALEAVA